MGIRKFSSVPPKDPTAFLHRKVVASQPSLPPTHTRLFHHLASTQRESVVLPPSLGGDIHASDKLHFPMVVKTSYAPYQKPVEENQLEIFILSFPVPSLPWEAKAIHSKYRYQIVNILGTDDRETFRVKAASQLGSVLWASDFCLQELQENWVNFPQKQELFCLSSPDATPSHLGSTSHLGWSCA